MTHGRFWVSFYAHDARSVGGHDAGYFFASGSREEVPHVTVCVVIDASTEEAVWEYLSRSENFPEMEPRFINPVENGWLPGDRFPGARSLALP